MGLGLGEEVEKSRGCLGPENGGQCSVRGEGTTSRYQPSRACSNLECGAQFWARVGSSENGR